MSDIEILGTPYLYSSNLEATLDELASRVKTLRENGPLNSPESLLTLRKFFKLKQIYHSNAIEGNKLNIGETRLVVERGLTLTGIPLKDQAEAKNLSEAIDYLEDLVRLDRRPLGESDIRQIHNFVLKGIDNENAGSYRKVPVVISGSDYKPAEPYKIPYEMADLFQWIGQVSLPGDNYASKKGFLFAAVAHTWFVSIHPFIDGNGRVGRLLMNLMLMRYGYPIAIILKDDRLRYYDALEESQVGNLTPILQLLIECLSESIEEYEDAARDHRERVEWAKGIAEKFSEAERIKAVNEFEVWMNAMELCKSIFAAQINILNASITGGRIYMREFGALEVEKYLSLREGKSTKRTWFFRMDFRMTNRAARYLFFFGWASQEMRRFNCPVSIYIAKESPSNSYMYERLDNIKAYDIPGLREIGYNIASGEFLQRTSNHVTACGVESIAKKFIEEISRHF